MVLIHHRSLDRKHPPLLGSSVEKMGASVPLVLVSRMIGMFATSNIMLITHLNVYNYFQAGPGWARVGFVSFVFAITPTQKPFVLVYLAQVVEDDTCGVRTHALADWRLEPAP